MAPMKCPDCGAKSFYIKDPEDQYTLREFNLAEGTIVYADDDPETAHLQVLDDTETFCERCAWHDKFKTLKG